MDWYLYTNGTLKGRFLIFQLTFNRVKEHYQQIMKEEIMYTAYYITRRFLTKTILA